MRESGILLHVSSLPSPYGIGTLGKAAFEFVDFLKRCGQKYWQVLPLGPTSYGDSPYQSFSVFAGNPYFIDIDLLVEDNLLSRDEVNKYLRPVEDEIDYGWLYNTRFDLFRKAFNNFSKVLKINNEEFTNFNRFKEQNEHWLLNYSLYMSIKKSLSNSSWLSWEDKYKLRDYETIQNYIKDNESEITYWTFLQYQFFKQWNELKKYANYNGIKLIGDMPIYVALDSCDVWSDPKNWLLDEELKPKCVAGVPPDLFSSTGQLWGNPIYNYELMKKDNYSWWIKRIKESFRLYDVVRIDHFRGFESYYSIPYGHETAMYGEWVKGPGIDLFNKIKDELGELDIIAEDLGFLTEDVHILLKKSGFPGMKILQFAFDANDDSCYLPHNYEANSISYTGTHDNMPLKEWIQTTDDYSLKFACEYLGCDNIDVRSNDKIDEFIDKLIKLVLSSVSNRVIIPINDYLHLGKESRLNTPSKLGGNWTWRLDPKLLTKELEDKIFNFIRIYRR